MFTEWWVKKLISNEALFAIVELSTCRIHLARDPRPLGYLAMMRKLASKPDNLELFAVAFRFGRALKIAKIKLQPLHIRNGWYSKEAYKILAEHVEDGQLFMRLEPWVHALIAEAREIGRIKPVDIVRGPQEAPTADDPTTISRTHTLGNGVELFNHPRRRTGRPRKQELVDHPRRRRGRPPKPRVESSSTAISSPPTCREPLIVEVPTVLTRIDAQSKSEGKPATKPPAWALALARRASGGGATG